MGFAVQLRILVNDVDYGVLGAGDTKNRPSPRWPRPHSTGVAGGVVVPGLTTQLEAQAQGNS